MMTAKEFDKLKELQKEIEDYGKYLERYSYSPYTQIQDFAKRLKEILREISKEEY